MNISAESLPNISLQPTALCSVAAPPRFTLQLSSVLLDSLQKG